MARCRHNCSTSGGYGADVPTTDRPGSASRQHSHLGADTYGLVHLPAKLGSVMSLSSTLYPVGALPPSANARPNRCFAFTYTTVMAICRPSSDRRISMSSALRCRAAAFIPIRLSCIQSRPGDPGAVVSRPGISAPGCDRQSATGWASAAGRLVRAARMRSVAVAFAGLASGRSTGAASALQQKL